MASRSGKRYGVLLVVLALALLSWWLQRQEQAPAAVQQRDTHVVDYSMRDFDMTVMDDAGKPSHRLEAVSMLHYADDDSAELEQPHLLLYRAATEGGGDEHWVLHAEKARLYKGGDVVFLQGEVRMRRLGAAEGAALELDTRDLWVYPKPQRAETGEAVEIREAHGVTRAQGLKINLKAGRLELLAAVRGEYVRKQ